MTSQPGLKEWIAGQLTFPASNYLFNRKHILGEFNRLRKSEWFPQDRLQAMQLKRLKSTLAYAYRAVPFYRKRFDRIGFQPGDLKHMKDLQQIPPVGRQEVIDYHREMVDTAYRSHIGPADNSPRDPGAPIPFAPFRRHKLVRNTSSGSTGAPTVFYDDGTRSALNWTHELRLKYWHGLPPGTKEARLTRLSTDYKPDSSMYRMRSYLWNQILLPGVNMGPADYEICLQKLLSQRPQVLWGFTSALAGLAEYLQNQKARLEDYRPRLAVGWAAPVYDHEERLMAEVFDCTVSNIYGAREVGHIAGKCPAGNFHVNQENLVVEQSPVNGNADAENTGELLVTNLDRSPMPFIRYRMGDIGRVAKSDCSCGRTLQIIKDFLGRTGEIFVAKDGRMISPNFWCRTFMSGKISGAVKRFQVIYTKNKDLRIKLVKDRGFNQDTEDYIRQMVANNFSTDTGLQLEEVDEIKPRISGKYQMVVNEAGPQI